MAFVYHHESVVFLGQIAYLIYRRHIAVHGEYSVGDDDAEALLLCLLQASLQVLHVGVGIAVALCLAQPHAVDDRGVVQSVADDSILVGEQRFEHAAVGIEAGSIEDGVLGLEIVGDGSLELLVDVLRTADEAHRRHSEAATVHHALGTLDKTRIVRQSQIVVGAEIEHFFSCNIDSCPLRALNQALLFVEACLTNLSKCLREMFFHFSVHSNIDLSCRFSLHNGNGVPLVKFRYKVSANRRQCKRKTIFF